MSSVYDRKDGEPVFMALPQDKMEGVHNRARATLHRFALAFALGGQDDVYYAVKTFLRETGSDEGAHIWLMLRALTLDGFFCSAFEVPKDFKGLNKGESLTVKWNEAEDWMIIDQGTLYGGYSLRFQREHVPDAEKQKFDSYSGITRYADELPCQDLGHGAPYADPSHNMSTRVIIGVPGHWATRKDMVLAIAQHSGGFLFAGNVLLDTATNKGCTLEVYEHDPHLQEAFRTAGCGRIPDEDIKAIGEHRYTLYCLSSEVSLDTAKWMLKVGTALLKSGGLGVKIESAGVAHSAARWKELAASQHLLDTYTAFVTLIQGNEFYYSCGMHNFGFPDSTVGSDMENSAAAQLLNAFNHYVLAERPALADGHTFSATANAPRFRLRKTVCSTYEPDHTFYNPFGMWSLSRA